MTTRQPASTLKMLFVFTFLYVLSACNDTGPANRKDAKPVRVHISVSDVTGKRVWDTSFVSDPSTADVKHMNRMLMFQCDTTGGSSRCGNIFEVWTTELKDTDTKANSSKD